jgi:apolipoprotein N-acyltransferase
MKNKIKIALLAVLIGSLAAMAVPNTLALVAAIVSSVLLLGLT